MKLREKKREKYCYDDVKFETRLYKNDFHFIYEIMWKIDCMRRRKKAEMMMCGNMQYKPRTMKNL